MLRSGLGKSLALIGYSGKLTDIAESDKLNQSHDLPHNNTLTPDKVLSFGGQPIVLREIITMI